jgi:exosortase K
VSVDLNTNDAPAAAWLGRRLLPWVASAAVLASAYALKRFYSQAGATELEWVLTPSCFLARLGGVPLAYEAGAGFISHDARMVVGPSCAGVNFLITAWLALFFTGQERWTQLRERLAWACASLLMAYVLTVTTNGLRILSAAHFYGAELHAGWLTPSRVHRLLGVALYSGALLAACGAVSRTLARSSARSPLSRLSPLAWYLAVVIGVPLANRAFLRDADRFLEHAILTVATVVVVVALGRLCVVLFDRLCSRGGAVS